MEKKGPDSITLTYDFLKWAIPALKKFPRDQRHFQDAGKQPYDKDATTLPWRALHNGRQRNKTPWLYLHTPPDNNWPLTLTTAHQANKHPLNEADQRFRRRRTTTRRARPCPGRPVAWRPSKKLDAVNVLTIPRIVILFFPVSTGGFLRLLAQEPDEGCASEKNAAQARITPPLHHLSFFYTIHGAISTDIPFPLTHAGPCAIEFPGAQVSRPGRPDSFQ